MVEALLKKMADMNLRSKFLVSIGVVLVFLTIIDVWFSMRREKELMHQDIKKWTFIFAENVRTTLNTLMREDKMDMRFAMLDSMSKEISGVTNVRIIRGPKVDEGFLKAREGDVAGEKESIKKYEEELADLEADLKKTKDADEAEDLKDEIASLKETIEKSRSNIEKAMAPHKTDPRELPKDELDNEVLKKAVPVYYFENDRARVLVPYISQKSCSSTSGCHKFSKEGDVLGAISMEFSTEDMNREILINNLKTAGLGVMRLIGLLILLAIFISLFVTKHINHLLDGLKRLTMGDFSARLEVKGTDEMGKLAQGFNYFSDNFKEMIKEIQEASQKMTVTSEVLSKSSSHMVSGTETQMGRISQVATATEEFSATTNEVAQNLHMAAQAANSANSSASNGGDTVKKTIDGMQQIFPLVKESSEIIAQLGNRSNDIGKIIGVINDIADQTNLLALNASIEAARAGEYGRGFAVVAEEVKKLAERTTLATKEIGGMIKSIQSEAMKAVKSADSEFKAVESAMGLAHEAGISLNEIIDHVGKVTTMIQQIATSSEQQSIAASQISEDCEAVSNVTKDRMTEVNHIADVAKDLSSLSFKLQDMIAKFRTDAELGSPQEPSQLFLASNKKTELKNASNISF